MSAATGAPNCFTRSKSTVSTRKRARKWREASKPTPPLDVSDVGPNRLSARFEIHEGLATYLVAYDDSESAQKALRRTIDLVTPRDLIVIVWVVPDKAGFGG